MPLRRDEQLRAFVQARATICNAAGDDFQTAAFSRPIRANKRSAIYAMHSYHQGKKPHDAIRQYVRHFTRPGELVLDPFCGSGGTALAAMLEGRTAIALDRSPAAVFIARNYCTAWQPDDLARAAREVLAAAADELDWLYETRCDRCGGRARTAYTVHSERFTCPGCAAVVPLADCPKVESRTAAGRSLLRPACPHCLQRGREEIIPTRGPRLGSVPVLAAYRCLQAGCGIEDQRRHDDADRKKREHFARYDLGKIDEVAAVEIPHWRPTVAFPPSFARWKGDLRNAGVRTVADLYTKRNLWALAALRASAAQSSYTEPALFALTAVSLAVSRMQRYSPDSGFPNMLLVGTYYLPPVGREIEVGTWYDGKLAALKRGYAAIARQMPAAAEGVVVEGDSRRLDVPSDSIDYIFTDPPYADAVQYGELNFVWEAWLGHTPDWHEEEIVVNASRGKDAASWAESLGRAMSECHRVLKPGRWLSLCYHDTSPQRWAMLQDLMIDAGFVVESCDAAASIESGQPSFNQWMTDKATKRDLVISFRKPPSGPRPMRRAAVSWEDSARQILREYLQSHGAVSKDRLYDALVGRLVCLGQMRSFDFDALLREVAVEEPKGKRRKAEGMRWRLKE